MRPQSAKAKGRRHQQRIVRDILDAFPHLQPDDVVSTSMGCGGEDLKMSPVARQSLPLSIEAKNQERLSIWSCVQQAETNTPSGAAPCVVFTKNHAKTYAVLPWPVLLDLYKRLGNAGFRTSSAAQTTLARSRAVRTSSGIGREGRRRRRGVSGAWQPWAKPNPRACICGCAAIEERCRTCGI